MKFEVDGEITINYVYPGMEGPHAPNRPTFYEIMTMTWMFGILIQSSKMRLLMVDLPS